jgi:hypothetical protein
MGTFSESAVQIEAAVLAVSERLLAIERRMDEVASRLADLNAAIGVPAPPPVVPAPPPVVPAPPPLPSGHVRPSVTGSKVVGNTVTRIEGVVSGYNVYQGRWFVGAPGTPEIGEQGTLRTTQVPVGAYVVYRSWWRKPGTSEVVTIDSLPYGPFVAP